MSGRMNWNKAKWRTGSSEPKQKGEPFFAPAPKLPDLIARKRGQKITGMKPCSNVFCTIFVRFPRKYCDLHRM